MTTNIYWLLGLAVAVLLVGRLRLRLQLSRAKHPSLAGHARLARRLAALVPFYDYGAERCFDCDDAPPAVAQQRRDGFLRLSAVLKRRHEMTIRLTAEARDAIPDLQFTSNYRVPFQFQRLVREHLPLGAFAQRSAGVKLTDLDGQEFFDLGGSYGVNLLGYDFYKGCIDRAVNHARELGPVLGPYHPVVADNVRRLRALSGLDEVSFHMSGTEAVMQAVRLARYHTRRARIVRFCGAYHGWWGDVQPGVGNPEPAPDTLTLKDMDPASLEVLRSRRDIACVLVNPLQALHPNSSPSGDSALVTGRGTTACDRAAFATWLAQLRQVCTERRIVLIFDEVFMGFRLAAGGAQAYFGVRADIVTYGKTLGGGLPVGVVCGRRDLMQRYREERPADICFARGTFNSHPYVMAAMNEFLRALGTDEVQRLYCDLDGTWNRRAAAVNTALAAADLPLRVANLSSVWVTYFTQPGRYHWMLQYYFHNEGLALGWTGTSRLIFSLNFSDEDMVEVTRRIVAAARRMQQDGWWWVDPVTQGRDLGRRVLWEMVAVGFGSDRTRWHASGRTDVRRSPTVPPPPPARP